MKKVLTLALVVCMLLSVIPMAVSAEAIVEPTTKHVAPTAPEGTTTVYVASSDATRNTEYPEGTEQNPYNNFEAAYVAAVKATNATADRKIVVIGTVYAYVSDTIDNDVDTNTSLVYKADNHTRFCLGRNLDEIEGTVYICGADNSGAINFKHNSNDAATLITLGADTVFSNIKFQNSNSKTIWINAGYYDLTMGEGITKDCGTFSVTGSYWNKNDSAYANAAKDGVVVSIYSGTYNDIYAANRSNTDQNVNTDESIELNIYGGTINKIFGNHKDASAKTTDNCIITINLWGGNFYDRNTSSNVASINGYCTDDTIYLYIWNGYIPKSITTNNTEYEITPKNFDNGNGAGENRFELAYVGVQNTEKFTVTPEQGDAYEAYSVRFVGVVDKLEYDEIGFKITGSNGEDYSFACKTVYSSILGDDEDVSAAELGGNYIFAATVYNIPVDYNGNITFTVQPYTRVGKTRTYGTAYDVTYNEGGHVSSVAVAAN